jgi:hypothetical protein
VALNRSNLATAETPINNELGSIYSYPQWKQINSDEDLTTEQDLPQYLDYYRTELFKKGELTREKEADIQNYYVNWASNGEEVSDAEFAALADKSTAFQSGNLNDERIVNKVFPNVDFAAIDEAKQNEYLNRAKRSLMASGQLPFATILEGGRGTVEVGDFESLGTTPEKKKLASERALSAVTLGAVDPRDLWQVSEGLESTRVPNKTNFEADLDAEDLGLLREMIGDKDSPYAKIINDAIVKSIDLETYRTEGNWLQQIFADRPEEINQILADELPGEIEEITPAILDEFARRKGWGDAQGAGLSVDNSYRFSSERISNLIKELSIVHTNNQGAFKYDEDKPENNLRITPMGVPIAHPTVMENPKAFNELLKDKRLTYNQIRALRESRRNYMYSRSYHIDDVLSSEHLESAVGDKWARAKAENPQKWKDDRVAFVDEFLSNEKNYDASKNWWGGVRASVPEAIIGIGASIGALLGNDASADYLKESQKKQSQRRELDSLFGGEFGIGYDLATILPSVGADLASTYFLAGPLTKGAKALGVGKTLDKGVAKDVALKKIISDSALDSKKTPLAIGRFNEQTAQKFGITSSLFLTSANRSAGATYASIYNSLPEDMSHEEKHDKALGAAFARGTLTGVITSGFSALGAGGLENIVARGASFRQFKNAINKVPNVAFQANDRTTKQLLRNVIAKQAAELYKKEANSSLIKKALGSAAAEGAEEGLDEFIGSFVDSAVLNEFVPMKERINQGLYAGGLGSILGGTMTVGSETFFGPDRLIKSTNVKSEENKKVLAVDKAIDQASQALDEAGLVISSEQLKEYLKTTDTDAQATPPAVDETVDEFGDAVDQFVDDTKEGSDVPIEESSKSIFTNFGKNFTKEDVTDYINGWAPTKIKEDIFIQYVDGKLPDNNPMRVGINAGTTDNPNIVLQVDTEKVTTALKDLKTHKQRKAALDAMLAHEFVHLSESSMLKQMWRKRSSQEEDLNFIEFSKRKLSEIYDSLVADEESKKLIVESVAAYKGLDETEVSLPGKALTQEEIASGKSFTMEKDEIVSEFTRQFIGSKNKLEDIVENKDLLTHFQSLVSHVSNFLDPDTSVKDRYSSLNENVSNYLNDIEAAYIGVLEKSLGARFKEFDPKKVPNIKQEAIEEFEEEIVEETVDPEDTLWLEANKVANRKLSKRGVREETEAKAQQAKIDKVEAYLLSDPKMQESIPGFNRDILNLIKAKYESVLDSKIAKSDSKTFTFPEISDRNGENYVNGNTVKTIKELIIDSKRPDLNGVGQNSDSTDVFLTKVLLELGTNVTTETQSAETIIENNPPSKIFRVESKRVVRPLNNKQADKTSQFTEEANELLEEADIHVKNLRRNYRKGNYGTYGATELAYEEITTVDDKYLELAQDPKKNEQALQNLVDEVAQQEGYTFGPVYHGTKKKFTTFEARKKDGLMFFSLDESFAKSYARNKRPSIEDEKRMDKAYEKSVQLKKKLLRENPDIDLETLKEAQNDLERSLLDGMTWSEAKRDLGTVIIKGYLKADKIFDPTKNWREFEAELKESWSKGNVYVNGKRDTIPEFQLELIKKAHYTAWEKPEIISAVFKKYDAILLSEGNKGASPNNIAIKNISAIKSADPVTYDINGDVIPLSQRFDISKRSILFSEEINIGLTEEGERDIKASPEEIRDFIRSGKVKKGWFNRGAADDITQGKTAEEVADYIISTTNNRAHAYLLNRIKGYLEGFVVKAPVQGDKYLTSAHPSRAKGYFSQDLLSSPEAVDIFKRNGGYSSWTPRNIYINERGLSSEIITHELVHAATEARLMAGLYDADKDSDLYKNVKELVGLVKGTVEKIPPKFKPLIDKGAKLGDFDYFSYTLNGRIVNEGRPSDKTISEFVAYGLSNVEFQNFLKSVQIKNEPDGLTKFVSFIRKVLGIPKSQNNALSELIRLTDNVLNTPKDAATMRAENEQVASWFAGPQPDPYDVYELAFPATPQRGAGTFPKEHIIQKRLEQGAKLLGSSGVPENIEEIASDWPKVMLSHTNITLGRKSRIEGNAVYDPEYPAGVMPYSLKFALPKNKEVKYNAFNVRLKNVGIQLDKYKTFIDGDKFEVPEEMSLESVLNSINIQLGRKQEKVIPMNDFLLSNPSLKGMGKVPKGTIVYAQGAKEVLGGPTGDLVSYNEDIDLNQEISSGEWSAIAYNPAQGNYFYKVSGDEKNPVFEVDQEFVGAEEILMVSDLGKQSGERGANHALLVKNAKFKKLTAAQVSEESFSKKLEANLANKEAKILIKAKFTKPQKARANDLVYRSFEETTEVFDSPDLDPISVEEGFIKTNEVALVNALADYRKTRGEDIPLDGYLESEFAIKSIEDGFLMDYAVESFADLGISNKYLSFISSENVPLFGPDSLFAEDAIKDEEVVKSIVSKTIKKLTAEAISGKNYSDSLAIIGAFPKLKEIAMKSLDTTIETLTANLDPDLTSDVDKEIALKLKRLGTARTHLRRNLSSQTTPQKVIVYNGGATAEAGLEQIRNVITKADDPQALTDIEKEFRTLIEVPIGQLGSYTSPIEGKSNWIKTLWSWFTGLKDPRWKREMERRESFMNGIRTEAESYIGQIERLVKEGWGGFTTEINTLLEQATGERNNLTISEEIDAALITERDAAKQEALNLEDPKEAFKVIAQADEDYELLVQKELNKVRQETRRRVNAALDKISEKSPELAETVRGLRYKITSSSRYVSEKLSEVDREDYKDIEARFSAQEGFYLTRTYRIFEDPSWSKFLYDKDDPRAKAIRLNAAREMFKKQQEDILSEQIVSLDKEAYKNNDVEWLAKSEAAKREEVGAIKTLDEVLKEKGMTEEDFLETVFETNFARYQEDQGPDILKRKKDVPKAIRVALGEIPDGTWNIIKTYEKVSYLANRIAIDANLERLGNPKNEEGEEIARPDQKWLLTEEETIELGLDNYEPIDPALKSNEGDRYSPLLGKGYFASPEMIESIRETRAFTPEPSTLGEKIRAKIDKGVRKTIGLSLGVKTLTSSTYYVRNVVGNTTYFALSLGLPPGTGMSKILSFREGKVKGELARAVLNPKEVDEYVNKLVKDGVIEREFSVAVYEDMLQGTINEESLEKETFEILDKIQKENGLETIEVDSDKSLLETLKHAAKKGLKVSKKLENRLQKLSLASDSFYKIAVYEYELSTLKKAREYDKESGVDTGFRGKSDRELELMAIDKLKKTAQYFSQNMPGTEGFSRSFAGALVAPYYRFRVEVARIMVNNSRLAYNEIKSENPIIKKRGYQRAAGAATVGAISTTATFAAEAALLLFAYGLGHRPADLTDEEKEALQLSVPPYLKTHTFLYTMKDGKYHSWDLTYLNPYSAYLDSVPTFQRALKRGESISSALMESSHVLFTAPFLEGQIATKAFYNALNNKNSKDEAIYFEHDDVGTKAAKSIASVLKEAYGAPTYMRLSENIKGMMSDDPTYTMGKLLKDELSPLKSYEIKPQTALYNFTRPMEQDKLAMRKALNKLATSKPVSDDELRRVIKGLKNSYGRLAKRYKDHSPSLLKIGATVNDIKKNGEELFTKEGYKNLVQLNAVPALFFSDRMKEVLRRSSNPEVRARLAKAAGILLEETNNGFIPLD